MLQQKQHPFHLLSLFEKFFIQSYIFYQISHTSANVQKMLADFIIDVHILNLAAWPILGDYKRGKKKRVVQ